MLCIRPSHGSQHHGVDYWFMPCLGWRILGLVLLGTSSGSYSGGFFTNLPLKGTYSRMYLFGGNLGTRCWKECIMFVNTLVIPFFWMLQTLLIISTGLGGFEPVGAPQRAFSTVMTLPQSFAFHDGMVWDNYTTTHIEPLANKWECDIRFRVGPSHGS